MAKETKEKSKDWEATIARLEKDYGKGSVMKFGDKSSGDHTLISTGSISFDEALGTGGFATKKAYELMGWEGTGKTTICGHLSANAQKAFPDRRVVYIDGEHALDRDYFDKLGVNTEEMIIAQPTYGEEGFNIANELVKTGEVSLLIIDSDTSMKPKSEVEGDIGDSSIGKKARLNSQAYPILKNLCDKYNTCLIVISQYREKIGVMFGNPTTTSGGHALKFYSDVRIEISKSLQKDGEGDVYGSEVKVKIVKNKLAPPFKKGSFHIEFGVGINVYKEVIDMAVELGIFQKSGSWINHGEVKVGHGEDNAIQMLKDNPEYYKDIRNQIKEKLKQVNEN